MTDHEPHSDNELSLELSQEALADLHRSLGSTIIMKGVIEDDPGTQKPDTLSEVSKFTIPISARQIEEIFCKDEDDISVRSGAYISYQPSHFIEGNEHLYETIYLQYEVSLPGDELRRVSSILLSKIDDTYDAQVDTEYIRAGKRVSPNGLTPFGMTANIEGIGENEFNRIISSAIDRQALVRPVYMEDASQLRQLEASLLGS